MLPPEELRERKCAKSTRILQELSDNEETKIWTCTVDPILFENFYTEDGDLLRAKFQAFKFPETNFVLFKGVVNVCLDKCNGVRCSNGRTGYGKRKRRDVNDEPADEQRVYEVSMSTVVKVAVDGEEVVTSAADKKIKETFISERAVISQIYHPDELAIAQLSQEFGPAKYVDFQTDNAVVEKSVSVLFLLCMATLVALL
jgi:hypothetical protein